MPPFLVQSPGNPLEQASLIYILSSGFIALIRFSKEEIAPSKLEITVKYFLEWESIAADLGNPESNCIHFKKKLWFPLEWVRSCLSCIFTSKSLCLCCSGIRQRRRLSQGRQVLWLQRPHVDPECALSLLLYSWFCLSGKAFQFRQDGNMFAFPHVYFLLPTPLHCWR